MKKKSNLFSFKRFSTNFKNIRSFNALNPDKRNIVFYSESGQDWHHFRRIIKSLLDKSLFVCYVTSDRNDPGLSIRHGNYRSFCINEGFWLIIFFQFLKADCLVLTMIDLNLFHLKRSIHPVHYIYLFHSMSSTHMVDYENSYDHYDTILCVGPHQIKEIRARERMKKLPEKRCLPHGYARIEELLNDRRNTRREPVPPYRILIAPTWGPNTILPRCGNELVKQLLENGFKVILRPHYQTNILTPEVVQAIITDYGKHPDFTYIDRMSDTQSLFDSDLLVCDWSSTSIEYALALEKPVLYIDVPPRIRNEHYMDLGIEPIEVSVRKEVGEILSPGELDRAPVLINRLINDPERFRKRIELFRKKILFNIGTSVDVGAEEIARIGEEIKHKRKN